MFYQILSYSYIFYYILSYSIILNFSQVATSSAAGARRRATRALFQDQGLPFGVLGFGIPLGLLKGKKQL